MKPEIERAMREVLEAWESDNRDELISAIYQMKRIYMAAVLAKPQPRPRKTKANYLVTIEFPPSPECLHGEVTWKEVEAGGEDDAGNKARLAVVHRIQVNQVKQLPA